MNNVHNGGAVCSTFPLFTRRLFHLLALAVSLFCCIAVALSVPASAQATSTKAVQKPQTAVARAKSSPKKNHRNITKKRNSHRVLYVKSQLPDEERQSLRARGISSGFGNRAISRKATRMHKGIDVPGPKDSKVIAYNHGEVIFVGTKNGYGKTVIIRQLDGREALYAHMNQYVVAVGDTIKRGDHIGHVGRTGRATGYHLHFEIIDDGENLDPALHVWHGSELVLGPNDLDPQTAPKIRVAEPNQRPSQRTY